MLAYLNLSITKFVEEHVKGRKLFYMY